MGIELLEILGLDVTSFVLNVLMLVIMIGIGFLVRALRLDTLYKRHKDQIELIEQYGFDAILRIANSSVTDQQYAEAMLRYGELADQREADGLTYIDPRMLYAIDLVEEALPENYQIDINIVLNRLERLYQEVKQAGLLDETEEAETKEFPAVS